MHNRPLISVIVPVYNVEAYLDKCIRSIVDQTYKNLEIILVDDGSPDRSGAICDAWAARDSRIRVIHQKNAGGGAARNAGLDIASGDLIAFVDSDDYLSADMYSHLYELLGRGADIAECAYQDVWDSSASFPETPFTVTRWDTQSALEQHIRDRAFRQLIWNKLYRRETVGSIRFPVGTRIDDEFFTYQVLANAGTLIRSDRVCYAYRQQQSSVMHTLSSVARLTGLQAKVQRYAFIQQHFPTLVPLCAKELWFTCLYQGQFALRTESQQEAAQILEQLHGILRSHPAPRSGCTVKERIWLTLAGLSFVHTCKLRNILKIGL